MRTKSGIDDDGSRRLLGRRSRAAVACHDSRADVTAAAGRGREDRCVGVDVCERRARHGNGKMTANKVRCCRSHGIGRIVRPVGGWPLLTRISDCPCTPQSQIPSVQEPVARIAHLQPDRRSWRARAASLDSPCEILATRHREMQWHGTREALVRSIQCRGSQVVARPHLPSAAGLIRPRTYRSCEGRVR